LVSKESPRRNDLAVSEVVGYVIIAGLILTSISIAYVNGYPALQDVRDQERQDSVASAFSVMKDNIREITTGGSAKRQTEMNLIGDSLGVDSDRKSWIHISIENSTGAELCNRSCNVSVDPVVYENSAGGLTSTRAPGPSSTQVTVDQILYENGAVIRDPGGTGSGMREEPDWVIEQEGVIIKTIATRGSNTVTGEGSFSVLTEHRASDTLVEVDEEDGLDVTVTVGTESPTAWQIYMNNTDEVDRVERNGDEVTMQVNDTEKVIRKKTVIGVEAR
jgi:hypothetical protein